jgi:ribonuclease G
VKKLIINYSLREKRFALVDETVVEKIVIEQPQQHSAVGNIYLGTVTKVLPGMNAVFVDIGEEKNGYLQREKLPSFVLNPNKNKSVSAFVFQGEKMLVQVEKDETGSKGPRLTGIIELYSEDVIYLPKGRTISVSKKIADQEVRVRLESMALSFKNDEEGFIFRTSAGGRTEEVLSVEMAELRYRYAEMIKSLEQRKKPGLLHEKDLFLEQITNECKRIASGEVLVDDLPLKHQLEKIVQPGVTVTYYHGKENIFHAFHVEHEIEGALQRNVELENGAFLVIDETEALIVIDVNTGKFSGKNQLSETVVQTNLSAAVEIAKQLRLRDIGGIILVDFIDMKSERDRDRVQKAMERELRKDDHPFRVLGFTSLGILQITRKKTRQALSEALSVVCPVCEGTGRVLSPETVAFRLERELWEHRNSDYEAVWVETTEEVRSIFCGEKDVHLERLQEMLGMRILLTILVAAKPFYQVRQFGDLRELEGRIGLK